MRALNKLSRLASNVLFASTFVWPWPIRRWLWNTMYGYAIDRTARVGLSWIRSKRFRMGKRSTMGHFNVVKGLDDLIVGDDVVIGRMNWITAFPSDNPNHFTEDPNRHPALVLEDHAGLTNRDIIDCTSKITFGRMTTIAGFQSQFITHSIDLRVNRQRSQEIHIGEYTFVGTGVIVFGGAKLPARSVLGAGSMLSKSYEEPDMLYGGVPAKPIQPIEKDCAYFMREEGFVK